MLTSHYLTTIAGTCRPESRCAESPELHAYYRRFLTRPAFLSGPEQDRLAADLEVLFDLAVSLPDRLYDGDIKAFARAVGWAPGQIDVVLDGPGTTRTPPRLGRFDFLRDHSGFRLMEMNMGSAMGGLSVADLNRATLRDPGMADLAASVPLGFPDTLRAVVDTMFAEHPDLTDLSPPVIALVDWPATFPTGVGHLRYVARQLKAMGLDAIPCHVGQITVRPDMLLVHGRRIDVIQRWFVVENLLEGPAATQLVRPILEAARRGLVRLFTPMVAELYGSKGCLAMLSDERNRRHFSTAERTFLDRVLPWTRMLSDTKVEVDGGMVDLMPYAAAHRGDLVLKPVALHGGQGVVPGWVVGDDEWAAALRAAVGGPYVLQRRIRPVREPFPVTDGAAQTELMTLNWGAFLTAGGYGGTLMRGTAVPDAGLISLANGARFGCCFHQLSR